MPTIYKNLLALLIIILMSFSAFAAENPPKQMRALEEKIEQYNGYIKSGGWQQIAPGKSIKPGKEDPRIPEIYKRLSMEGYLECKQALPSTLYSDEIVSAVMDFQYHHNLIADGIIGKQVIKELNVSADERLNQIKINIERLRKLPAELGKKYIRVNITGFNLKAVENGREVLQMRIIAGQAYHPTPIFSSTISEITFHPYWYATDRLSYEYVLPKIKKDLTIVEKYGYELLKRENGKRSKVALESVKLNKLKREDFDVYMFRQKPGPNNAMGGLKFTLASNNDIYMHDTPSKELFDSNIRTLSNGCVRLESPLELAKFVLHGKDGWPDERIEELYNEEVTQETVPTHVKLDKSLPVYIVYLTADIDDSGSLIFYDDVYDLDNGGKVN